MLRALLFVGWLAALLAPPAAAQTDPPPELVLNPKVELLYGEPANAAFNQPPRDQARHDSGRYHQEGRASRDGRLCPHRRLPKHVGPPAALAGGAHGHRS